MLTYLDIDQKKAYRFEARRLRIQDNLDLSKAREDLDGREKRGEISEVELLILYNWPLLKFGSATFQVASFKTETDDLGETRVIYPQTSDEVLDLEWKDIELSETVFYQLTEEWQLEMTEAFYATNPHRS